MEFMVLHDRLGRLECQDVRLHVMVVMGIMAKRGCRSVYHRDIVQSHLSLTCLLRRR
jgi:hypothetical protein